MNKVMNKAKTNIINQKKKYIFLLVTLIVGILSGIIFMFFISNEDKLLVKNEIELFLLNINQNKINYSDTLINSVVSNLLYILIIWVLGISVIGIPIIIFLLFFKGFIFGFSFSSIIYNYGFKGILLSISYQLPHNLFMLLFLILICFYAINFSIRLFRVLFFKEKIDLNACFKKYNLVFGISILGMIVCSLFEVFLVPITINLFL